MANPCFSTKLVDDTRSRNDSISSIKMFADLEMNINRHKKSPSGPLDLPVVVSSGLISVVDHLFDLVGTPTQSGVNASVFPTLVGACCGRHHMPDDPERIALCLAADASVTPLTTKATRASIAPLRLVMFAS